VDGTVGYLVAIIFLVLALNLYFTFKRVSNSKKRIKKGRVHLDEEKQAIWRDKEIARRIAREHEDALERVNLRNETLAYYEEVRRRHAGDGKKAGSENIVRTENTVDSESKIPTEISD